MVELTIVMIEKARIWVKELRAPFFVAVIIPVFLGAGLAAHIYGTFDISLFLLTLLGIIAVHAGSNVINDYFDYRSGTDLVNENKSPFNGGSPFLITGELSPQEVRRGAYLFFAVGLLTALVLTLLVGWIIFLLFALGVIFGYFYTHSTVNLAGRGVGELAVWFAFGPLTVIAAYYVQAGTVDLEAVLISIPIGLMISNIILVNEFPDREADQRAGKKQLVVRMGKTRAAYIYGALTGLAYLVILVPAVLDILPLWYLAGLVTLPLAWKATRALINHYMDRDAVLKAQAWTIQIMALTGGVMTLSLYLASIL